MIAFADAVESIAMLLEDELVVTANGQAARYLYSARDRPENFYMLGSMGLAAPIALGLALACPQRRVVVFDGDGNLLMGLGHLAMIGERQPSNLVHLVFDNGTYASTGGQRAISDRVDLGAVAVAAGYRQAVRVAELAQLHAAAVTALQAQGPSLLSIVTTPGGIHGKGRVEVTPLEITSRVRKSAGRQVCP